MADRDILRQLSELTRGQIAQLKLFLFPSKSDAKKSIKPKDQGSDREKDTD